MSRDKIIIFDIDGTVVDSPDQKMPSARAIQIFKKLSGNYVLSAATGRSWTFAKDVIQSITKDPSIVSGGTQIRANNGDVLWQRNIEPIALKTVLNEISVYEPHSLLFNDYSWSDYLHDKGVSYTDIPEDDIYFLEAIFIPDDEAIILKKSLDAIDGITCTMVSAQRPHMKDLHITDEFATKEHAVAELLKITQIDVDRTIGIGDGHNDLHLFNAVKTRVAMGDAVDELKAEATTVIDSVSGEGLAKYLEGLL